mgnify:CR=1 FL=1
MPGRCLKVGRESFFNQYWEYLSIPLVSALVGYGTNWLAVKMMMGPLTFRGVGPIGWQGVIPANAEKMARVVVRHCVEKVLPQSELMSRIDPDELTESLQHRIQPFVEELVDTVMEQTQSYGLSVSNFIWSASPLILKNKVYKEVSEKIPAVVAKVVEDIKNNSDDYIDLNQLIVEKLTNNKQLLVDIFKQSAKKEFIFIERSGFYFGLPLGLPVMFIWYYFPVWWLLPFFGLLVGYITNALAIYLIQKPIEPIKVGPVVVQGLFLKRQEEVWRYYGSVFSSDLLRAEVVAAEILKSQRAVDHLRELIHREVNREIESAQGPFKALTVVSIGPKEYAKIGKIISELALSELQHPDKRTLRYIDQAFDIEETVADRVGNLPGEEFFELLHPIIEEDEWKLIAVGAALGLVAGIGQWLLLT